MRIPPSSTKEALVLSGGGAKGAYEVGVMKALFEGKSPATGYEPLSVELLTGTSVGAYSAAFLAGQEVGPIEAIEALETIWRERIGNRLLDCGNGVFDLRDGPFAAVDPGCAIRPFELLAKSLSDGAFWARYAAIRGMQFLTARGETIGGRLVQTINAASLFDPAPLYELIADTIDPSRLRASDTGLTVATTNWNQGTVRLFDKVELSGPVGPKGIAASAAIPGIFPPIIIDGISYHDGAVLFNTPLMPAIKAGAEVIHLIFLDPKVADIPLDHIPNTMDTLYRLYAITTALHLNSDIKAAESILRELELNRDLGILGPDLMQLATQKKQPMPNTLLLRRIAQGRPYRPLTIHTYRPESDLKGLLGLLDFSAAFIDELIELGYRDAVNHDCGVQGCVLPRGSGKFLDQHLESAP